MVVVMGLQGHGVETGRADKLPALLAPVTPRLRHAPGQRAASGSALPLVFSQFTNRNPPGDANGGAPGGGVTWSCSSSIGWREQSQQASDQSPGRRVRESSMTCTSASWVTSSPSRYRCAYAQSASELWIVGTSGVWTPDAPW